MKGVQLLVSLVFLSCLHGCFGALVTKNMNIPKPKLMSPQNELDISEFEQLANASSLPPIVCIPGVGGSQLFAVENKVRPDPWYCGYSAKGYMIWLALSQLLAGPALDCWSSNIALYYNETTDSFSNATGVEIIANYFGTTQGFEYLDPAVKSETVYFANLVQAFVKVGYVRGQNLLGAPYDWRLAPKYSPKYIHDLQQMIEGAYEVNESKVIVVAHSMGNLFFLSFLQTMTQEWKDKYILTYFATSPPWVGAFTSVQSLTSGYNFGIPYLNPATAKIIQRTFLSSYFLLPYTKFYQSQVLVSVPGKNYTSLDYESLLDDIGVSNMYEPYLHSFDTAKVYEPPGVDTYCLYGYNVSTAIRETYTTKDFVRPIITHGDGDGTVPVESLTFCNTWKNQTDKLVFVKGYKGQEHVDLLSYAPLIQDILSAIFNSTYL